MSARGSESPPLNVFERDSQETVTTLEQVTYEQLTPLVNDWKHLSTRIASDSADLFGQVETLKSKVESTAGQYRRVLDENDQHSTRRCLRVTSGLISLVKAIESRAETVKAAIDGFDSHAGVVSITVGQVEQLSHNERLLMDGVRAMPAAMRPRIQSPVDTASLLRENVLNPRMEMLKGMLEPPQATSNGESSEHTA